MLIESVFYDYQVASWFTDSSWYIVCFHLDHCQMEVYPKDCAAMLTNMQTPFYAQNPTLMSTLENNNSAMVGKLVISVMG